MLTEGALMIALATALSFVKILEMPQGGSITLGSMVPILLFAYRWGGAKGTVVATTYGILQMLIDGHSFYIWSFILDYVLAYGVLGILGFLAYRAKHIHHAIAGVSITVLARFGIHFLSGVLLYASYAPEGETAVQYSIGYNSAYMLPELIISILIFAILFQPLQRVIKN